MLSETKTQDLWTVGNLRGIDFCAFSTEFSQAALKSLEATGIAGSNLHFV